MSRYTVVSSLEAEDDLALVWTNHADRKRVSEAANAADKILSETPLTGSIYLSERLWRLEISPLRFYFEIREEDRLVEVTNVICVETM